MLNDALFETRRKRKRKFKTEKAVPLLAREK